MERFTATLVRNERGGTTAEIPFDVAGAFGSVRVPVLATINGFTFRIRTMRYGGVYLLGLNREAREGAGLDAGDTVAVELELDATPRLVDLPHELASALGAEPELRAFFDSLSYTHRREYARWISEAKRDDTRRRRLQRALDLLRAGVKTPDDARSKRTSEPVAAQPRVGIGQVVSRARTWSLARRLALPGTNFESCERCSATNR